MPKAVSRSRELLTILIIAMAVKVLFGDLIGGFMDGMIIGFTDGI